MREHDGSPNVIIFLTTQWRGQATGFAGDGNVSTPFLDSLAEEALDFYQAVTPHPFGVFARAALLTGRPCPENGVSDYYDTLPAGARTLAHLYRDRGYETAFFGKWQLYERDRKAPVVGTAHAKVEVPLERRGGFEFWEGFNSGFLLNDGYYHGTNLGAPTQIKGYQAEVVVDRFCQYLYGRAKNKPFFSIISVDPPHPPYGAEANGVAPRSIESIALDESVPDDESIRLQSRKELSGYYAHIQALDGVMERLVETLRRAGEWENTLFAFASAHGDMLGSQGLFRKGWPYEESVRVPLLLSWPSQFRVARRDPLMISLLDLGPTLYGLCFGDWEPAQEDKRSGRDLSDAIRLKAMGPEFQTISMPSVPPFEKQCPYAWTAERHRSVTHVLPEGEAPFRIEH